MAAQDDGRDALARGKAELAGAPGKAISPARAIGRALWQHDFEQANPTATVEQRRQNWAASRERYLAIGKHVAARLAKDGFMIEQRGTPAED